MALRLATATPESNPATPTGGASLRWFTYIDASNWYYRYLWSSAEQNIADANGRTHYNELRRRVRAGGPVEVWGETPGFGPNSVYWNGSSWEFCAANAIEHTQTTRDANGVYESFYCGLLHSRNMGTFEDITGKSFAEVMQTIRGAGFKDGEGDYAAWGLDPDKLGVNASVRLNKEAKTALFEKLGLPLE